MPEFVSHYTSPLGTLEITASDEFILSVTFEKHKKTTPSCGAINRFELELDKYFRGDLKEFSIPFNLKGTDFQKRVWREVLKIPYGKTISYTQLALNLGDLKCIRAAGTANGKNKLPILIPCHRVIGKNGSLVGFAGGLENKKWLLRHEGVIRGEQVEIFA